jgi:hypothetical protein
VASLAADPIAERQRQLMALEAASSAADGASGEQVMNSALRARQQKRLASQSGEERDDDELGRTLPSDYRPGVTRPRVDDQASEAIPLGKMSTVPPSVPFSVPPSSQGEALVVPVRSNRAVVIALVIVALIAIVAVVAKLVL